MVREIACEGLPSDALYQGVSGGLTGLEPAGEHCRQVTELKRDLNIKAFNRRALNSIKGVDDALTTIRTARRLSTVDPRVQPMRLICF